MTAKPKHFSYRVVESPTESTEYIGFCRFNLKGFQQAKHEVRVVIAFLEDSQELFMTSSKEGVQALGRYFMDLYGQKPPLLIFPRPKWILWHEIGPELKPGSTILAERPRKAKKNDRRF